MDLFNVGLILKSVKTGLLGIAVIILIIQMVKTKNKLVQEAKLLCIIFLSLGFFLNLIEVTIIPKSLTLVFPATGPYDRGRFARFIIWGFIILSWTILMARLLSFRQKQDIASGNAYNYKSKIYRPMIPWWRMGVPKETRKRVSVPIRSSPQVDVRLMIIVSLCLMIMIILRYFFKLYLSYYDLAWIIIEIVEFLLWVTLGISMVVFKERVQKKILKDV